MQQMQGESNSKCVEETPFWKMYASYDLKIILKHFSSNFIKNISFHLDLPSSRPAQGPLILTDFAVVVIAGLSSHRYENLYIPAYVKANSNQDHRQLVTQFGSPGFSFCSNNFWMMLCQP